MSMTSIDHGDISLYQYHHIAPAPSSKQQMQLTSYPASYSATYSLDSSAELDPPPMYSSLHHSVYAPTVELSRDSPLGTPLQPFLVQDSQHVYADSTWTKEVLLSREIKPAPPAYYRHPYFPSVPDSSEELYADSRFPYPDFHVASSPSSSSVSPHFQPGRTEIRTGALKVRSVISHASQSRTRTAQACEKCRARKAKCSGEHPSCQRCRSRGIICEYRLDGRVRGLNRKKAASLQSSAMKASYIPIISSQAEMDRRCAPRVMHRRSLSSSPYPIQQEISSESGGDYFAYMRSMYGHHIDGSAPDSSQMPASYTVSTDGNSLHPLIETHNSTLRHRPSHLRLETSLSAMSQRAYSPATSASTASTTTESSMGSLSSTSSSGFFDYHNVHPEYHRSEPSPSSNAFSLPDSSSSAVNYHHSHLRSSTTSPYSTTSRSSIEAPVPVHGHDLVSFKALAATDDDDGRDISCYHAIGIEGQEQSFKEEEGCNGLELLPQGNGSPLSVAR